MIDKRVLVALALGWIPVCPVLAQDDFQQWLSLSARVALSGKAAVQNELVARSSDDRGGLYEVENSLVLGYKLSSTMTAWAGYVHNPNYTAGDFAVMERRAREQITIDNFAKIGGAALSARLRLEQRWRDGLEGTGWRVRPYVKVAVPLGSKTAPALNLTAESFVNLNNSASQSVDGLERLRSAISLTFPVSKAVNLEAGYLNQHRFVRGGADTDDHVLTAALWLSF